MCRQIIYALVLGFWCTYSLGCVAYMEHQAANAQTGDPSAGGYFGYNQDMADARLASMQAQRDSARQSARGTAREAAVLRTQLAEVKKQYKYEKNNALKEALKKEYLDMEKYSLQMEETIISSTLN
jgi:hypothetical protein